MKEQEIRESIENEDGTERVVVIIYEYDGGIQVNGVYEVGGYDELPLTKEQMSQVEMHCIDHYAGLCDAAQAAEEDRGDWLMEQRRDYELEQRATAQSLAMDPDKRWK